MRTLLLALYVAGICSAASAATTKMISVMERNSTAYVSSAELERSAAIAVKKLPGTDAIVACSEARCARVKSFLIEGEVIWVNVAELAKALGFAARFSLDRQQIHFEIDDKSPPTDSSITGIGDLAPNLRLARLDGRPVSLADFRGQRVLIQSWGSW